MASKLALHEVVQQRGRKFVREEYERIFPGEWVERVAEQLGNKQPEEEEIISALFELGMLDTKYANEYGYQAIKKMSHDEVTNLSDDTLAAYLDRVRIGHTQIPETTRVRGRLVPGTALIDEIAKRLRRNAANLAGLQSQPTGPRPLVDTMTESPE